MSLDRVKVKNIWNLDREIFTRISSSALWYHINIHCVSRKVSTFKLSASLSNLNRFSNFCTAGKRIKFATKPMRQYPPHLRHVATLPWEINNSNFLQIFSKYGRKCKQIALLIASNFASRSPYWLQINFSNSLLFYLFTFAMNLSRQKFVTADVTAVSINNQHGIQR